MNTVQELLTDAIPPFPFFIENPAELNRAELQANKASINEATSLPAACDVQASAANVYHPPQKGYQQDALFAGDKDALRGVNKVLDTNPLPERCQFFFSDGRQCRMGRSEIHPSLCRFHAEREDQLFGVPPPSGTVSAALDIPELHSACRDLTTATGVNRALAQVFRLLAQRRISRQEAATFGYLAQLLLRTISAARAESLAASSEDDATSIVSSEQRRQPIPTGMPPVDKVQREPESLSERSLLNKVEPQPGGFLMSAEPECNPSPIFCRPRMPIVSEERFVLSEYSRGGPLSPEEDQHLQMQKIPPQLTQNEHVQNLKT
jgi:hypothetical protein